MVKGVIMCNIFKVLLVIFFIGMLPYEISIANDTNMGTVKTCYVRFKKINLREEQSGISFIKIQKCREVNDNCSVYKDVLEYSKQKPFGDESGRNINVHETVHGIHSDYRNEYQKQLKYKLNALYCLNGNILLVREPNITIRHVIKYIPKNLQSYRYELYFVKQLPDWNDVPTYILDEWIAYILGSKCAVEDHQKGINTHRSDAVSGCLDFSIYATAFAMAVKEHDPDYWSKYPEFKETIRYHLIQAEKTLGQGLDIREFNSEKQDILYNSLLNDDASKNIRDFLFQEFDGIFVD